MLDLCTLGTGGAVPLPDRALSSLYVRVNGQALLIDCGEGTQTQIRRLGWGFKCIDAVLLTHYHADHCGGLPGFLLSVAKTGRTEALSVYGPPGLRRIMDAFHVIAPQLPYPITLYEIPLTECEFDLLGLHITSFPLRHSVPCLGYRLDLSRQPAFDAAKARALGVPVTLWRFLQQGQTVTLPSGAVHPQDVMGAPRRGLRVLYATDTRPVEAIARLGHEADLMILEGMYGDESKRPQAEKNRHMLFAEAAALARDAAAHQLLLTHFSNSIDDPEAYLPQAQRIFPETHAAQDGLCAMLNFTK